MEFLRKATEVLKASEKHVDTGMGFERLVRAIEGKSQTMTKGFFFAAEKIEVITSQS